ncbi:TetR/AcrR family transcriptional regulator [Aliikangiella marina]|uniref:TetR/AcrR family transcriptional regulator n=1 Tax=Aliikangiella marina TaxID=1712262 RepID=A0A545T471_9GAMM|nr:TetR/AcrR family transcriptional regulator [Aliikangiella marina]TQV71974.1 TetR/AcrR family transcriptional regulator [Aliikangiella marina]TQV72027.1 TetR/AcrR family transcriptional regulator [Aliikangiella marina]
MSYKSPDIHTEKASYHHGDLRNQLLSAGLEIIKTQGINALSLRKLAEKVGVSRTAPYHHFKNKNELLCAIAAFGFQVWTDRLKTIQDKSNISEEQRFREFAQSYVDFAVENPDLYDLMFGQPIWKESHNTGALKKDAYPAFQYQRDFIKSWQDQGILPEGFSDLRLSQVIWSTLHGIARLVIDGIYLQTNDSKQVAEMCDCAVKLFLIESQSQK